MANLLQTGSSWLADQMKSHASVDVTYVRGAWQIPVKATIGKTEFELEDGSGAVVRIQSRDYLIQAADLVIASSTTLPLAGDRIREVREGTTIEYEVLAPGDEPHYRYSDPFGKLLRIHTKLVSTSH